MYRREIHHVIKQLSTDDVRWGGRKTKDGDIMVPKLQKLLEAVTKDWVSLTLFVGLLVMLWASIVDHLHSRLAKKIRLFEACEIIEETKQRFNRIRNASQPVEELLKLSYEVEISVDSVQACAMFKRVCHII